MKIYLIWDTDPEGGHLSAQDWEPDITQERPSVIEIREVEIQDKVWQDVMEGKIEVNPENPYSLDHIWMPYWIEAGGLTDPLGSDRV